MVPRPPGSGATNPGGRSAGGHARMKVGCQRGPTSDEMLQYFAQLGVTNICGHLPLADGKKPWTVAEVEKLKKRVESHGISLDMLALPLSSSPDRAGRVPEHHARPRNRSGTGRSTRFVR